jgi:hypothetical protein
MTRQADASSRGHHRLRVRPPARAPLLVGALFAAACGGTGVEIGHPLEIRIDVENVSRPIGASHEFSVNARGRYLLGLTIDYGDGESDLVETLGAQTVTHAASHIFGTTGDFLVRATIEDAVEGELRDSVMVQVTSTP